MHGSAGEGRAGHKNSGIFYMDGRQVLCAKVRLIRGKHGDDTNLNREINHENSF